MVRLTSPSRSLSTRIMKVLVVSTLVMGTESFRATPSTRVSGSTSLRRPPTSQNRPFQPLYAEPVDESPVNYDNPWEWMAMSLFDIEKDPSLIPEYVQAVSLFRVGMPALVIAATVKGFYPSVAMTVYDTIHDASVFAVVAQDASQFIQNICTTSGLVFSLIVGQTYYFMVRTET